MGEKKNEWLCDEEEGREWCRGMRKIINNIGMRKVKKDKRRIEEIKILGDCKWKNEGVRVDNDIKKGLRVIRREKDIMDNENEMKILNIKVEDWKSVEIIMYMERIKGIGEE